MRFQTIASLFAAFTNAVQLSECVQLALSKEGSTPLDPMIPRRYRRLAAILQIPVLIALLAGEVAKVRAAFDGDDEDDEDDVDWDNVDPSSRCLHALSRASMYCGCPRFSPDQSKVEWVES